MTARYAAYWAPEDDHVLWRAGCDWLGRDAASGDTATGGKDKASLTAQLNLNGQTVSSLSGPITFRIGDAEIATGSGSKGKFALEGGARAAAAKPASVKASINANGQLKPIAAEVRGTDIYVTLDDDH